MHNFETEKTWVLINRVVDMFRTCAFGVGGERIGSLSPSQHNVLGVVYSQPDGHAMVKDIAAQMNLTPGAVSQTVESLVRLGIVERAPAEHDRRAVVVRPSAKGRKTHQVMMERVNPVLEEIFSRFEQRDLAAFMNILEELAERLSEVNASNRSSKRMSARTRPMEVER